MKCKTTTCPFIHMYSFSLNISFLDPYSSLSRSPSCSFVQLWWSFFSFVHPLNVSFLAGKHNLLSAYNFMTLCLALAPEQKRNEAEMACHFHTLPSKPFMFGTPDLDQGVDWPIGILSIPSGKQRSKSLSSDKRSYTCSKCSTPGKTGSRWLLLLSTGLPLFL